MLRRLEGASLIWPYHDCSSTQGFPFNMASRKAGITLWLESSTLSQHKRSEKIHEVFCVTNRVTQLAASIHPFAAASKCRSTKKHSSHPPPPGLLHPLAQPPCKRFGRIRAIICAEGPACATEIMKEGVLKATSASIQNLNSWRL
eukprot:scaffold4189_cov14-Tisochrysis_lutea.AAC.4